jgi:hypothetical protein
MERGITRAAVEVARAALRTALYAPDPLPYITDALDALAAIEVARPAELAALPTMEPVWREP